MCIITRTECGEIKNTKKNAEVKWNNRCTKKGNSIKWIPER